MARYSIRHDPLAIDEFEEAADWYERQDPGTGAKFTAAVKAKLLQIVSSPHRWAREYDGTRHALLLPFKYMIVFREKGDIIEIIALCSYQPATGLLAKAPAR
jgi:plasmid stabilization system protein ParE